jgi:hypothetical protein
MESFHWLADQPSLDALMIVEKMIVEKITEESRC